MNCEGKRPQPPRRLEYAQAYVPPQKYENLFSPNTAIKLGTIFRDLYRPYNETE